jgi:hypothetical protein
MSSSLLKTEIFYYLYTCKRQNRGSTGLSRRGFDLWSVFPFGWTCERCFILLDSGLCLARELFL